MSTIKRLMACALSATLALVFSACDKSPAAPTTGNLTLAVTVQGIVGSNTYNLGPLGYVLHTVDPIDKAIHANQDGVATIDGLPAGDVEVLVGSDFGFATKRISTHLVDGSANTASAMLVPRDDMKFLGASVDGLGDIQSGATVLWPANLHLRMQVMEGTFPGASITMAIPSQGNAPLGFHGYGIGVNAGDGALGSKIVDLALIGYEPCGYTDNTLTVKICQGVDTPNGTTDHLQFLMFQQGGSGIFSGSVSFVITWVKR